MKLKRGFNEVAPESNLVIRKMMEGHPDCKISIGSRVVKIYSEPKDVHQIGDKGVVVGNYQIDGKEAYLVQFDNDAEGVTTFLVGEKIKEDV